MARGEDLPVRSGGFYAEHFDKLNMNNIEVPALSLLKCLH
jgi:hypothetical protein